MAHDVFVSYASGDKQTADAVVARLEKHRIRCWIAPRDVRAGERWAEAVVRAIESSQIMVLVFSAKSNKASSVMSEVSAAADNGTAILPFRIEEVDISRSMEFFLGPVHWLDALTPPMEDRLEELAKDVREILLPDGCSGLEAEMEAFYKVTYETNVAETKIKEIVERYPSDAKAYQFLGEFYNRYQQFEKAIAAFKRGIELDGKSALLYWDLALAYQKAGRRADAAGSLEEAIRLGLDDSRQQHAATLLEALRR